MASTKELKDALDEVERLRDQLAAMRQGNDGAAGGGMQTTAEEDETPKRRTSLGIDNRPKPEPQETVTKGKRRKKRRKPSSSNQSGPPGTEGASRIGGVKDAQGGWVGRPTNKDLERSRQLGFIPDHIRKKYYRPEPKGFMAIGKRVFK